MSKLLPLDGSMINYRDHSELIASMILLQR